MKWKLIVGGGLIILILIIVIPVGTLSPFPSPLPVLQQLTIQIATHFSK